MKTVFNYILALLFLAAVSCQKKKYPEASFEGGSTFYSKLLVNGTQLDLTPGEKGYYMFSSFSLDSSNVYNLVGEFKQTDCNNCTNSLRIQINDSKNSATAGPVDIDNALKVQAYNFLEGSNDLEYSVSFTSSFNKAASSVLWDFGDGTTSPEINPVHIFRAGKYPVTLTTVGPGGCQSISSYTISVLTANDFNAYVTSTSSGRVAQYQATTSGGNGPYTYLWSFGDGDTLTSHSAIVTHSYNLSGSYGVKVEIKDAQGKNTTALYNGVAADPSACAGNFSFSDIKSAGKRFSFSKSSIRFTDADGLTYTSDNELQPIDSKIEVLSIEEFVKNENGNPVKKLKLKFNCTLYNGTKSVSLQGTEVIVGLAYK